MKEQIATGVSAKGTAVNIVLSAFKLLAGITARSGAMISDAVYSASDVFGTVIVIAGGWIAGKEENEKHQYEQERMECVASMILAVLLCFTGIWIGLFSLRKIISGDYGTLEAPGILALAAAVISVFVKEIMYRYTKAAAKKIGSSALMAEAWHHRSDALFSIGSFIGIFGARMGFPVLDPVASVVICGYIVKTACDIFLDSAEKMMDEF